MKSSRPLSLILGTILGSLVSVAVVSAWTAPTGAPPTANVSAPINVSSTPQVKNAAISVNGITVYGATVVNGTTANLDPAGSVSINLLPTIKNTGLMVMGWNRSTGGGEADFMANRQTGGVGGFNFYDYSNTGVSTLLLSITGAGAATLAGNMTAVGYFHSSDARLKTNINTSEGLELISKLRGVTFQWKKDGMMSAGVIAQEVEQVLPNAVHTDAAGMKTVEYDQLLAPLIESIKQQQAEIKSLRYEIEKLKTSN